MTYIVQSYFFKFYDYSESILKYLVVKSGGSKMYAALTLYSKKNATYYSDVYKSTQS